MNVCCQICNKEMSVINNRHLKTHNITAEQYKDMFPNSLMRSELATLKKKEAAVRSNQDRKGKKRSVAEIESIKDGIKKSKKPSRPKKIMSEETKRKLSEAQKKTFEDGRVHHNLGKTIDDGVRKKISDALSGRKVGPEIALKALETKKQKGMDLAFFRGRLHSEQTKQSMSKLSKERFLSEKKHIRKHMIDKIVLSNLTILNEIDEDVFKLKCNNCGYSFTRTPQMFQPSKFHTEICDQCYPISPISQAENELADYIASFGFKVIRSDSELIAPLELDIFIPEKNIAIEYCGLYWHSEQYRKRYYHRTKWDKCKEKNIKLITIFEDEWINKREIVCSKLSNMFGNNDRVFARNCEVVEIFDGNFLNENHLQGSGRSNLKYGLVYNNELISVMSFSKSEISRKLNGWDINRFCSKMNTTVIGGAGKLFKHFLKNNDPKEVTSYADLRWGDGSVYGTIGFSFVDYTVPGYWYFKPNEMKRYHRFGLRKKPDEPQDVSEYELRLREGWNRIWDCGNAKWKWTA